MRSKPSLLSQLIFLSQRYIWEAENWNSASSGMYFGSDLHCWSGMNFEISVDRGLTKWFISFYFYLIKFQKINGLRHGNRKTSLLLCAGFSRPRITQSIPEKNEKSKTLSLLTTCTYSICKVSTTTSQNQKEFKKKSWQKKHKLEMKITS